MATPRRSAMILLLACGAQLMVVLDGLIVNVALPQMRSGLGLSAAGQQWVIDAYLITCGGLLLLAARAADLLGHRRVFLVGVAVFTLASLAGGLASDATTLVAARSVQGVGAAALAPTSLSLLTTTHTGADRVRALSVWSATAGSAGALGLVLGGVVTQVLGWRWVLLLNVPIGVVLWTAAARTLAAPPPRAHHTSVDVAGAVTVTLGTATLVYGITQGPQAGWTSVRAVVALLAAGVLLTLFWLAERRCQVPLVPLATLRRRNVLVANLIIACLGVLMTSTLFFLSLYQQRVLGDSPLRTGIALLPMSIVITAGALVSKSLLPRLGPRAMLFVGALLMAAGLMWLAAVPVHAAYLAHILGPTLLWAAGAGIVTMPCVVVATSAVEPGQAGLAAGIVNSARQIGGALGLAVLSAVAGAATARVRHGDTDGRIVHGYSVALIAAAGLALVVAALASQVGSPEASRRAPGSVRATRTAMMVSSTGARRRAITRRSAQQRFDEVGP